MMKSLDAVPYKQRQWGHAVARNAINAKQKLGLGLEKTKRDWCFGQTFGSSEIC